MPSVYHLLEPNQVANANQEGCCSEGIFAIVYSSKTVINQAANSWNYNWIYLLCSFLYCLHTITTYLEYIMHARMNTSCMLEKILTIKPMLLCGSGRLVGTSIIWNCTEIISWHFSSCEWKLTFRSNSCFSLVPSLTKNHMLVLQLLEQSCADYNRFWLKLQAI